MANSDWPPLARGIAQPSGEDFWTLLAQSPAVPRWPRRFSVFWPDPRPTRAGIEHPVEVEVLDVEGKIPRVGGETPWMELRALRLTIRARDYDKYTFQFLAVPVPREVFVLVQPFDDFDEAVMTWTGRGFCVAFRIVRIYSWQNGCAVRRFTDWFPDGRPDESGFLALAEHRVVACRGSCGHTGPQGGCSACQQHDPTRS